MKVLAIIQARMGSSRLPGKMLIPIIDGKGPLELMIERVSESKKIDKLIVATTTDATDDKLFELCRKLKVHCYRGSVDDVLDRFYNAASLFKEEFDTLVRLTGDCPFHNPRVIDLVINNFISFDGDYVSNVLPPTFPDGLDTEVFTFNAIEKAWKEAELQYEREHLTQYIWNHPEAYKIENVVCSEDFSSHRWTLDEKVDLVFVKNVYEHLYHNDEQCFGMREILELIDKNPEIKEVNHFLKRNEKLEIAIEAEKNNGEII